MKYIKPADQSDPNAPYVDANPSAGIDGSIVPARAIEPAMREITFVITQAGITPSDSDLTQLWQAILNAIAAHAVVAGSTGAYLPLAGGTMNMGASINLLGSGRVLIAGQEVWWPGNDGPSSGLDADTVDGVHGTSFVRNDTDSEPAVHGKVKFARLTASSNSGVVIIVAKDSQLGGGRIQFQTDAGAISFEEWLDDDRRTMRMKMWSGAGATYEDQARWLDTGELWLRKLGNAAISGGNVAQAIIDLYNFVHTSGAGTGGGGGSGSPIGTTYTAITQDGYYPGVPLPGSWVVQSSTFTGYTGDSHSQFFTTWLCVA
ncbi:MAG: hypothetical protein JWM36_3258 [Hyphomicrobiales bacterium]|nr:hypothetical protein [Hyphomicrobiales bacterium]